VAEKVKDCVANAQVNHPILVLVLAVLSYGLALSAGAVPTSSTVPAKAADEIPEAVRITHGDPSSPLVALTFDDAPDPLCPRLLAVLREQKIKCTFFLIGKHLQAYPAIAQAIVAEGHEIGNHSMSHADGRKLSSARAEEEVDGMQKLIQQALGVVPTLYRPPYGNTNASVRQVCARDHLQIICWDVDPNDWQKNTTRESVTKFVLAHTTSGSIVLLHATKLKTVEAAADIIQGLRAKGFQLVTVSELLKDREARLAQRKANARNVPVLPAVATGGQDDAADISRVTRIQPPALPPL
jgi:peptidoglycan/xylan/chitin deacetylase (PgdA/CDA1 family)